MNDITADFAAALKNLADPKAHTRFLEAKAAHDKSKSDAVAEQKKAQEALADLKNRAYQLDKRRDELDTKAQQTEQGVKALAAARNAFDAEREVFGSRMVEHLRAKAEFDERFRDLVARENALRERDVKLQATRAGLDEVRVAMGAFEKALSKAKAAFG